MPISSGLASYKVAFQISPIFLQGGIAQNAAGIALPLLVLLQAIDIGGLFGSSSSGTLDNFFGNFQPLPGATLIDFETSTFPAFNQVTAANAVIAKPLTISMAMTAPVKDSVRWGIKLATMAALQSMLSRHGSSGGTYIVGTPSFFYTGCILTNLRDITPASSKQSQAVWQFDFFQSLTALTAADNAYNAQMAQLAAGLPTTGAISGAVSQLGGLLSSFANPSPGALSSLVQ